MKVTIFGHVITIHGRITKLEPPVIGIRSNLDKLSLYHPKAKHLLMLDFDDKNDYQNLEKKLMKLQDRFGLGDCEIFESSYRIKNGKRIPKYHGYLFGDFWHYFQCCEIIHYAVKLELVDPAFARWRMIRPNIVLRFSRKAGFVPKYVGTIVSKHYKPPIKWFRDFVYDVIRIEKSGNKNLYKEKKNEWMKRLMEE